ncbi:MAG TPA: hypothetical protein VEZ46_12865 [Mycobacteriales bacterium]|jgi:hypothetical protein|nr:hypothetical protein [Mycobacteriales bacterium]
MPMTFALLPSPFLGPAVWEPVAAELRRLGHRVIAPGFGTAAPAGPADVLAELAGQLPVDQQLVLVAHSNAGLFAPVLTTLTGATRVVFVDAVLPAGIGPVPVAPARLVDGVRDKADGDGLLPVWTSWWDEADVAPLFPDDSVRRRVQSEQRRLPLAYLEATVDVPAGWDRVAGAYLAFGPTYAEEQARAAARGWPVAVLPGRHLHMLVDPAAVAAHIVRLAEQVFPAASEQEQGR